MKDYCTGFPEYWYNWTGKKMYIGNLCKKHDDRCGTKDFYKDLWRHRIVGAVAIATVASIACWVKYPKLMSSKL